MSSNVQTKPKRVYKNNIYVDDVALPEKHVYPHAVEIQGTLYVSGIIGWFKKNMWEEGQLVEGDTAGQTKQIFENLKKILKKSKSDFERVLSTTVLLTDMNDLEIVNNIYKETFKLEPPARSVYEVSNLPWGAKVQIEAIAITDDYKMA